MHKTFIISILFGIGHCTSDTTTEVITTTETPFETTFTTTEDTAHKVNKDYSNNYNKNRNDMVKHFNGGRQRKKNNKHHRGNSDKISDHKYDFDDFYGPVFHDSGYRGNSYRDEGKKYFHASAFDYPDPPRRDYQNWNFDALNNHANTNNGNNKKSSNGNNRKGSNTYGYGGGNNAGNFYGGYGYGGVPNSDDLKSHYSNGNNNGNNFNTYGFSGVSSLLNKKKSHFPEPDLKFIGKTQKDAYTDELHKKAEVEANVDGYKHGTQYIGNEAFIGKSGSKSGYNRGEAYDQAGYYGFDKGLLIYNNLYILFIYIHVRR